MPASPAASPLTSLATALSRGLGDGLIALYQVGPAHAAELLLAHADALPLATVRAVYRRAADEHGWPAESAPRLVPQATFDRLMALDPGLAWRLSRSGRLLAGRELRSQVAPLPLAPALSELAAKAMVASVALAPALLSPAAAATALSALRRLEWRVPDAKIGRYPDPGKGGRYRRLGFRERGAGSAVALFGRLQDGLRRQWPALQGVESAVVWPLPNAPPSLPDLVAVYEAGDQAILVLPALSRTIVAAVDWPGLAETLAADYAGLQVTTADQLRLALQYELSPDFYTRRYRRAWGHDLLAGLEVAPVATWRQMARDLARLRFAELPRAYLATADGELPTLIHDQQNRLLNVQLRNELLGRLVALRASPPPEPLPSRESPAEERVAAIAAQMDWWLEQYLAPAPSGG
jgi:hypothetical protein